MSDLGLKRLAFGVTLVALAGYLGISLLREPSTPEERVRYAIEDAINAFNDQDLDVMRLFAKDYQDEATGTNRQVLERALQELLWSSRLHSAELLEDLLNIEQLDDGSVRAAVGVTIKREGQGDDPWWSLRAVLEFKERGRRWKVIRSTDVNHLDRPR